MDGMNSWWSWILLFQQIRLRKPVTGCHSKDPVALFSIGSDGSASRFSKDYFYRWCPAFWSWHNVNWVKNIQPSVAQSCSPYVAVEAPISIIGVGKDSTILLIIKYNITITLQWLDGISWVSLARTREHCDALHYNLNNNYIELQGEYTDGNSSEQKFKIHVDILLSSCWYDLLARVETRCNPNLL